MNETNRWAHLSAAFVREKQRLKDNLYAKAKWAAVIRGASFEFEADVAEKWRENRELARERERRVINDGVFSASQQNNCWHRVAEDMIQTFMQNALTKLTTPVSRN